MDIDFEQAKLQLEKIFASQSDHRKIVFWYDAQKNFEENVKQCSFDDAKILIYDNNPFTIKETIEVEDTESNFLVYFPCAKPRDEENWLADMTFYVTEYYADTIALTMRRLGISNENLRRVIERHIHFFDSKDRVEALGKKIDLSDETSPEQLVLAMMSTILKTDYAQIDYILSEAIFDFYCDNGEKYSAFSKYGLNKDFWDMVSERFSYSGKEDLETLGESFLLTAARHRVSFSMESPIIKPLLINSDTENVEIFVSQILMNDSRYRELDEAVWNKMRLAEIVSTKGIDSIGDCDTFHEFDEVILASIESALAGGSYDYDSYSKIITAKRLASHWFGEYKNRYDFILYLIEFYRNVKPGIQAGAPAEEYIEKYTREWWHVDNNYRHVIATYRKIEEPNEDEEKLVTNADSLYQNDFLSKIGPEFSLSLKKKEPDYHFASVPLSKNFFRSLDLTAKKQFVIISDALRYEVAEDLLTALNQNETFRGRASLGYQMAPLPSITMFGMAALLPNQKLSYQDKKVFVDGRPTMTTVNRNAILSSRNSGYAAIKYEDIVAMNKARLRQYMADKSLVYIYHDVIDNAGEHDEPNVFEACEKAIEQIVGLVKKLYNSLQISNYTITADHGFVYRSHKIDESDKYPSTAFMQLKDASQRYAIVNDDTELDYTNQFSMSYLGDCESKVMVPYGYDLFRKQGGGIQYVHGGASLQEIIVPIITLKEMRGRSAENLVAPVKVRLKSSIRKIMNKSFSLQFEQCEKVEDKKVPLNVAVYFVDEDNTPISDKKVFIANKTTDDPADRLFDMRFVLENREYDRNKSYFLKMENADTGDALEQPIRFVIDIVKFKMF